MTVTRDEFLRKLRGELSQNVSDEVIQNQLQYYNDYINEQIRLGNAEEAVVEGLGDPRLLAKTIIDAAEAGGDVVANETPFRYTEAEINYNSDEEDLGYRGAAEDSESPQDKFFRRDQGPQREEASDSETDSGEQTAYDGQSVENGSHGSRQNSHSHSWGSNPFGNTHVYTTSGTGCFVLVLITILVLYLLGMLLGGIFTLLSPVLLPLLVVAVILWFIKGILDR